MRYHIENNTVQETLIIPLYGRAVCAQYFPDLLADEEAVRLCAQLDYDFASKQKKMTSAVGLFGALEVAQRHYDLMWEVRAYLQAHPQASVVNMGSGLDDTFRKVDNGTCHGYNIDLPDVIAIRNDIMPPHDRETNIGCDLNDDIWMDQIEMQNGAIFFASGVFYYFKREDVKALFCKLAERFPGGVLVFDTCNERGAKMMTKTWLKEAGITDVHALFSLNRVETIKGWSEHFASVTSKSYMRGYRDLYRDVRFLYKLLIQFCEHIVKMRIVKINFKGGLSHEDL